MTSAPNSAMTTSTGTATHTVTRSARNELGMKPRAPPAARISSGRLGLGMPLATWTSPSTPSAKTSQPTGWRPVGPLAAGSRRVRHAMPNAASGSATEAAPKTVENTTRSQSPTAPGNRNQKAAAVRMPMITRNRPVPSRRSSGSRSRTPEPMLRTNPPSRPASPRHSATMPRPMAARTSPKPPPDCFAGVRRVFLDLLPPRVVVEREDAFDRLRVGEDARVAMGATLTTHPVAPQATTPPDSHTNPLTHPLPRENDGPSAVAAHDHPPGKEPR